MKLPDQPLRNVPVADIENGTIVNPQGVHLVAKYPRREMFDLYMSDGSKMMLPRDAELPTYGQVDLSVSSHPGRDQVRRP